MNMKELKLEKLGAEAPKDLVFSQIGKAEIYQSRIKENAITKLQMSLMKPGGTESDVKEWIREDKDVRSYMSAKVGGPAWSSVV